MNQQTSPQQLSNDKFYEVKNNEIESKSYKEADDNGLIKWDDDDDTSKQPQIQQRAFPIPQSRPAPYQRPPHPKENRPSPKNSPTKNTMTGGMQNLSYFNQHNPQPNQQQNPTRRQTRIGGRRVHYYHDEISQNPESSESFDNHSYGYYTDSYHKKISSRKSKSARPLKKRRFLSKNSAVLSPIGKRVQHIENIQKEGSNFMNDHNSTNDRNDHEVKGDRDIETHFSNYPNPKSLSRPDYNEDQENSSKEPHAILDNTTNSQSSKKIRRVRDIGLRQMMNIRRAILFYGDMSSILQQEIRECNLSLSPAILRCNAVHGPNSCEEISPTLSHIRCASGYKRVGCCKCAPSCPSHFLDKGFYCEKSKSYYIDSFASEEDCESATHINCE